jgi:hypothetical protein
MELQWTLTTRSDDWESFQELADCLAGPPRSIDVGGMLSRVTDVGSFPGVVSGVGFSPIGAVVGACMWRLSSVFVASTLLASDEPAKKKTSDPTTSKDVVVQFGTPIATAAIAAIATWLSSRSGSRRVRVKFQNGLEIEAANFDEFNKLIVAIESYQNGAAIVVDSKDEDAQVSPPVSSE